MGKDTGPNPPSPLRLGRLLFLSATLLYLSSLANADSEVASVIAAEVLKISLEQFEGDDVLIQKFDSGSTQFWHPNNGIEPVYERKGENSEDVLVLSKDEDKLESGKSHSAKQTYVVLRKKDADKFYPLFAYLRNARQNEVCPISGPTSQLCIEWDSWETRVAEEPSIWLDCSSQVFLSCGFNNSVFEKDQSFQSILTTDLDAEGLLLTGTSNTEPEVDAEVDDNLDIINSTDYDFFDDLHGVRKQGIMGRSMDGKKGKVQPRQDGKLYDLCLDANLRDSPNCFNGLGLSLDLPHPLQYSRPSSSNLNMKSNPRNNGKPNYKNYQPIKTVTMSPYRKGITFGTFTPEDSTLKVVKGSMYVFGPGSLDVFKADFDTFGTALPDNQGTVGTYSSCKITDATCMIHGVLIPLDSKTAYMIRSGLAYPASFKTTTGIPKTRGFVVPLENKQIDLFYPDSFVTNNLRLNNPLEKPMSGSIDPHALWAKLFPEKNGLLFPRKWVASIFIRQERPFEYAKFTQLDGFLPSVRVAVTPGQNGLPDEFYSLEEPLLPPHKIPINLAFLGTVTFGSGSTKTVPVYAIPSARHGEVDKFIPSDVYYLERVAIDSPAGKMTNVKTLMRILQANKGEPITGQTVEVYLYRVDLKAPGIHKATLIREDGSKEEGTLYVDKTVNPVKFTAKKKAPTGPKSPASSGPTLTPVSPTAKPKSPKNPKKATPTKPGELRYPTYKNIGTLAEPVKYHVGYETGSFKPDDKTLETISVKAYILGMDKPDMLQGNKQVFGTLYPTDKGVAGTFVPNNPNPTHEIHGVLIPLNENTGVIFRDGLGYPCSYKIPGGSPVKEILGFYAPSMRKQTEFFYPESFITFKELSLPYHVPIEGKVVAEEPLLTEVGKIEGQLLPREDGVASVFIRGTINKFPGTFQDAEGKLPPAKLIVIPGKEVKPDEFYPLDGTLLDSKLPVNGTVTTDPATIPRRATFVRTPNDGTPDIFVPLEGFDVQPIKFHVLKRKLEPLTGVVISPIGVRIPPRVPVDLVFDTLHQQPVPSRLLGNLETQDEAVTRGNIIVNLPDGQLTFFPDVREVPKDELAPGYAPDASQKYNKLVPYGKADTPKEVATGVTIGNFVPDTDNNGKAIRISVHTNGPFLLDSVECEDPVFGRELPEDHGVPGTYTAETRKGKKKDPIHGILIPVDKNRAFFLLDGTGYYGAFQIPSNPDASPIQGFIVPVKGTSDRFYFESYITFRTVIREPTVNGRIVPDKSVGDKYHAQDIMLILKRSEPSIIIPLDANPEEGTFTPDDSKHKPIKMIVVPKKGGNPDEFFPLDDDEDPGTDPLPGSVKSPTKDARGTLIPNLLPGASDEFIPEDDPEPSDLIPVTISSTESNLNDIKAFIRLPKGEKGPPTKPTPLFVTEGIQIVPTRLQATMKMPDDSAVVGLLAADSPTGPFTFYPGASNPLPSSLKLMPRYDEVITNSEPTDVPTIPAAPEEVKTPVPVSTHRGYPSYVPIGKSDEKIVMKLGATLGNFVPDEENERQPLRIAVVVVGPKNLDSVESEKPIFGQELPEDRGTEGTYTPDEKDGIPGTPIHGILIPIDPTHGYFLRNGIGYEGKFTPKDNIAPTWGFVIPSQPGIRTADHFYPESFVTYNLKGKPRLDGELEPDKKVQDLYKTRSGELLTRRVEPNILLFKNVGAIDGTFQDNAKAKAPKKLVVVPESQGNPDEFYPLDDDDDNNKDPKNNKPVKGTITAKGLEKAATMLPNPIPGAPDVFIPEEEEIEPVTIESAEVSPLESPLDTVKAFATLPPGQKGPITAPTEVSVTQGAEQLPSRMQAKLTVPNKEPVEGLLVADTPNGPFTFFPGMQNPEATQPKPLQITAPEEPKKEDPSKSKPKQSELPQDTGRSDAKKPVPTILQGDSEDEEESTSTEQVPPELKKCSAVPNDYPTFGQYGTSTSAVEYNIGVTPGVFVTEDGKSLPVVVHVVGVDNLDVLESEDPIFGSKLPDDMGTVGTFTPDNPKSGAIRGVVLPVTSHKAYIVRDGTAYLSTFHAENDATPPVLGFRAPSMIKNREADFFYPQAFACAIIDSPVKAGEMVPHQSVEQFFPKAKGKLILNPWGNSIFIPDSVNAVEGSFQDDGSAHPPSKVLVIPETSRKPNEFYPIENVLQNGELTPGKITTPEKELKVNAVARPSKQGPDFFYPEEETVEVVTLISKDRSVPKQKAVILWKVKPKGPPKSAVKVVPLTKTLTLPFKVEVTVLMDDGTFINGLLAQNGVKDSYMLYPFMKDPMPMTPSQSEDDGARKPGSESKYPKYVQFGTSSEPIEYLTGVSAGNIVPDETPEKRYPAVVAVEGIGKLDLVEFENPVFGTELPIDKGTLVTFTPTDKKRGNPLRGVLIPLDPKKAYLIRDGLAYTCIFVPHKNKFKPIEGFLFQNSDKTKETQPFIPETLVGASADDVKGILDGILVPDAETAKFFPDTPGKLVTNKKKPYTFIPSKVKVVEGEFQDADKAKPPKKVLVVPGANGDSDEFYPLDDDLLPEDTVAPVKGSITTPDKVTDVVVIPNSVPGTPDKIVPEEVAAVAEVTVTTPDDNVKAQMVRPKGEKGRPKKPVELTINEGLDKLKPREEGTLNLDDGTKVPGLLVGNPEAGSATFFPGVQDTLAPTAAMAKEPAPEDAPKADKKKPKPSTSKDESPSEPKEEVKKPVDTKYPTYVMYGQSDAPIEYRPGGTLGTFSPEDPKREPLPATVFVFGVDKLDIIQFDDPIFGDVLPEKTATVGIYNPEGTTQKPIRGVVIPIDERRGYILRDGIAYTAIFYPKKESAPSEIVGFLIRPLSGDVDTELFVAESYITYKEPLSKQNQLPGNMVPSTEASVFFPPTSGKLLTRGQEPSIYIPDSVEIVPGTFQDETLLHPPIKVHVIPAKEGSTNPDQIYPGEDEIPEKKNIMKGTVTTPWKMIEVSVVPSGSPKIPPQIVITDEKYPEPVTFEKTPGPVKAYLLQDNDNAGIPTKTTDVVLTKPEDETLPISQEVNLILGDGKNRTGLLVAKTPGGVYQVFFPGALQPAKQPKVKQVAEPEPEEKPDATDPARKGDLPTEDEKRPRKSGLYPTYIIHTPDSATLEYFIGATEGTFITDDNPPKSLPVTLNVLGADKLDVIVSTTPIFGSQQLPIDTGIAGTFKPTTGGPGPKNPQRSIHGVILPVDESTALVIRDGLAFPVTLYLPENQKDTHGFFVPLLRRPIEVFYPDSIKTFEPIVADIIAASPSNLVPAEIVPDQEIDRLAFPDSKGQIDLNRKGRNRYISDQFPDKTVVFKDDEGKVSINFKVMEGSGDVPNEYIAVDKDLPQITDVARGTLTDPDGSSPAAPNDRAAVLSLPKAADGDVTEYEVYPEHMFIIREVQVTSRNKKLKNVEGYVITSKNAKDGTPVDIIFKTFKASLTDPKHSVTVSFVDDGSVVRGMLFTNHISGPHTFFPAGGRMQYNSNEPTFEMEGPKTPESKQKDNAADPASPATTANSKPVEVPSKPEQSRSEPVDHAKPKAPVDSVKPKPAKLKTPTPVFAEENDDWPFNMVYEPTEDNKEASIPEDKKPDKAIQAIILPLDGQNKKLFAIKGKIPTSTPERGKPLIFLPYKIEEAKINYFRGTLRMPGDPAGDLEGRFRAPKRASTPPVFIVDPLDSDPAVFVANNNPRVEVYGYVISTNGDFRFMPDESLHVPTQPTPGILRISEKQNKVGVLMTPLTPDDLCEFRTDSPKTANAKTNNNGQPIEVYFYPDLDTFKPIRGTVTVIGDKMSFVPDPAAEVDKSALPLHGLVVSPTDVIASVFGFIYPAASDGGPFDFKNDKPGSVLTDFRPDSSEDTLIRGVFIPSKTEHEAAGQFIVSGATIKIPLNQLGILNKKNTQGQPAIGMMTEKNGKIYFDADDRICIEVTFYPDVVNSQPTQGLYIFSKGGPSGEFRPTIGEVILVSLPVDGQIVPKADTHPQVHGTLKQSPNGAAEYDFEEDPPNTPPDNAVDLVGSKDGDGGAGNVENSGVSVEIVYIWGMYFVGIGNINIFIPRAGATGTLVANDRPPTDPNAIKFEGLLTTHEAKTACSGATYYATFIPDYNGRSNNLAAEFPSTIQIVFYPAGSISGGIVGTIIQKDENQWMFIVVTSPKEGRWRPPPGVNQFTYDEAGQIIAYDYTMIWFRQQERDKTAGVKIKGGYYKGTAGVNVIVPEAFKSGAMFIISGENKLHGKVYPLDKGKVIKFIPDDEPTAYTKVKEADNKLSGQLDLDESLSVNGKTPDNGIPGSLKLNEKDEFIITPDTKGQWGYFIPGKKPLPMMVVMCFTTTVQGIAGRSMDDGSDQDEGKCSNLKHTYYIHEKEGYVLQICHRTKNVDEASVEQRSGY